MPPKSMMVVVKFNESRKKRQEYARSDHMKNREIKGRAADVRSPLNVAE
jgi:hypothetical protein